MASEEVVGLFKTALQTEREGMALYQKAAENAHDPLTKQMFKSFATDEKRHLEALQRFIDEQTFGEIGQDPAKRFTGSVRTIFTDALKTGGLQASGTDTEAILKAVVFEKNGISFYTDKAKSLTDKTAKALCERLAVEEQNHLLVLENTLEFLDKPTDWFMGEERWMFDGG